MARKIYVACICEANVDISIGMIFFSFIFLKISSLCFNQQELQSYSCQASHSDMFIMEYYFVYTGSIGRKSSPGKSDLCIIRIFCYWQFTFKQLLLLNLLGCHAIEPGSCLAFTNSIWINTSSQVIYDTGWCNGNP